jgi:hypothetical protein
LFDSIKLNQVERITQIFINTKCFDIQSKPNEAAGIKKTTLCAGKTREVNEWVSAILEFKKCNIVVAQTQEKNKKDVNSRDITTVHEEKLNQLRYSNQNRAYPKSRKSQLKENLVKTQLNTLVKTISRGSTAQKVLKRKMVSKMKNVKTVSESVIKQEEEIRQALETRSVIERKKHRKLIKMAHKNKEIKLINEANKKLREERVY